MLASSTQVDSVVPTVPDSRDAVQVDRGGEAEFIDTESNRTASHREEDVVDGGSEVEPHASMTVLPKSTKRLPGQHHDAESVRGVG